MAGDIHPSFGYSNGFAARTLASLARTLVIEAAQCYRFPARIARHKLAAVDAVPEAVREIAWKAQTWLCKRYRQMMAKGKLKQVVVTAIARKLAGFVWATVAKVPPAERVECQRRALLASRRSHPTRLL
jgi:hypothetical protein